MRTFLLLLLVFATSPSSAARFSIYDSSATWNPLESIPGNCHSVCGEYFSVSRALAPLVIHSFVALVIEGHCGDRGEDRIALFGAPKGQSDLDFFLAERGQLNGAIRSLGRACGEALRQSVDESLEISRSWSQALENKSYLCARLLVTPLMGRPCKAAARSVGEALKNYLVPVPGH